MKDFKEMLNFKGIATFYILQLLFWGAVLIGYVLNIQNLLKYEVYYKVIPMEYIIGVIGLFIPPLGAFMGFFVW